MITIVFVVKKIVLMVQIFNSIFPKVCKNGFRTFVPGALEMLTAIRPLLMTILHWHIVCSTVKLLSANSHLYFQLWPCL